MEPCSSNTPPPAPSPTCTSRRTGLRWELAELPMLVERIIKAEVYNYTGNMTDVVIKKGGIIELPEALMSKLGLTIGKKVVLSIRDKELLLKPVENITERITDSIKLEDKKLIEEIVETEEWV